LLVFGQAGFLRRSVDAPLIELRDAQGQKQVRIGHGDAAQAASTEFYRIETFASTPLAAGVHAGGLTLLEARIRTGRTHQIRVHARHLGLPIAGDARYGDFDANKALARASGFKRMFLHASRLQLAHPADGRELRLEAELPAECQRLLEALRG
ncbi:MAG: hypothetical protein N3D71_14390, partial [Burkholderiaceae bacterium]|nr:hypothetical protein [Burkholderiaceae bacterium]